MKKPLTSTSANITGQATPKTFQEISTEILKGVDYVVNLNREKVCKNPSSIIKLTLDSKVQIIRK
jgi:L-threonylcarbamoyladenylate synthase